MATARLYDAWNPANWIEVQSTQIAEVGPPFAVVRSCYATRLGWYRQNAGANRAPPALNLWRRDTATVMVRVGAPADNGTPGWQWSTLPTPIALEPGIQYTVSYGVPVARWYSYSPVPPTPVYPDPFLQGVTWDAYHLNAINTYPETTWNGLVRAVDLEVDDSVGGGVTPPATDPSVANALASWLSTTDYTHADSAPIVNWQRLLNVEIDVDAVLASVGAGLNGIATYIQQQIDDPNHGLSALVDTILSGDAATQGLVTDVKLDAVAGVARVIADLVTTKYPKAGLALDAIATVVELLGASVPVPGAGWTLVATTPFDSELAWAQAADLYVLTFDTFPPHQSVVQVAGVSWYPRLAWWTPLNADQPEQRRYVDFSPCALREGGQRMPGLLLRANGPSTGTVQAWQYA